MRSQVVKQAKPNAKFEVHTAVGVAGVVGTDFFLGYLNGIFQLIVFDGHVKFCNLDGVCVDVLGGQIATIRDGHKSPDQPSQATATELTEAANATMMGTTAGEIPAHHIGAWTWVGTQSSSRLPHADTRPHLSWLQTAAARTIQKLADNASPGCCSPRLLPRAIAKGQTRGFFSQLASTSSSRYDRDELQFRRCLFHVEIITGHVATSSRANASKF
jgi:hypothetical protein